MDQLKPNAGLATYLIRWGACSEAIVEELLATTERSWVPLGLVLVKEKRLSMRSVAKILTAQADRPKALFGDVAVDLGLCTEADVEHALQSQKERSPHLLDAALDDPRVDREKLVSAIRDYVRFAESMLDRLNEALPDSVVLQE